MKTQLLTKRSPSSLEGAKARLIFRRLGLCLGTGLSFNLLGCSLITHSSLDDCEKTGECEAPPSCDPESGTCEPGTGGATAIVDPSTGGGTGIVGSGGSTIGGPGGGTNDGGTGGAVIKPECMPQSEICNGEDDDCNGAVDEGCPSTFAWENEIEEEAVGDGFGGSYFGSSCASDEIVVGLRVKTGSFITGVGALCSRVSVEPAAGSVPYEYRALLEQPTHLSGHNDQEMTTDLRCNDGHALVGIRAALQNYDSGTTEFVVLTRTWIRCAPVSLAPSADALVIASGDSYEKGPVSGTYADNTAWFGEYVSQRVVSGIHGMGGSWIDRMGLRTAAGSVF